MKANFSRSNKDLRQQALRRFAQRGLPARPADAQARRQGRAELGQVLVEEGPPRLREIDHVHAVTAPREDPALDGAWS